MKKTFQLIMVMLMIVCIPISVIYASENGKEEPTREQAIYVNKQGSKTFGGSTVTVTVSGYVYRNTSTGLVTHYNLSASVDKGTIDYAEYSISGSQVLCQFTVTYNSQTKGIGIIVP